MQEIDSSKSARRAYQQRCLEALHAALDSTPMYESWLALDPGEDCALDARYAALPALSKDDIRRHFPYGLVPRGLDVDAGISRGEISFIKTSGTADESLTNIWNQRWWDASERASWALNNTAARVASGSHREAILASALSVGPLSDGRPIPRTERILGRFLFLNEYGSTAQWPEGHELRILAELAEFQPAVLEANPSLLARLARFARRMGELVFQPPLITLTYEFPSQLQLRAIRDVFDTPIASSYGSTEAGYVFMECECGRLHQNSEFCRVDLLPVEGGKPGEKIGRILATTFGNPWFQLLRFEIGDLARVSAEPCPCSRDTGMTLSSIEGRLASLCLAGDGRLITHRELDEVVARVEGIEEYRLDQETPRAVRFRAVIAERDAPAALRDACDALHDLFGSEVEISVEQVDRLVPEASGKFLLAKRGFPLSAEILQKGGGGYGS